MKKHFLKIIPLYKDETRLVKKAAGNNREAQQELFRKYASRMLSVCRYYIKDEQFAEDVMITAFFKVLHRSCIPGRWEFRRVDQAYYGAGMYKFPAKEKSLSFLEEEHIAGVSSKTADYSGIDVEAIQFIIDALPQGYKTVFLMYAIEGYSHKEIAETLHISENTSKHNCLKRGRCCRKK